MSHKFSNILAVGNSHSSYDSYVNFVDFCMFACCSDDEQKYTVSNVESLAEKSIRKSPRLMNQSAVESCCLKVSSQERSLRKFESPEEGCPKALSLNTSNVKSSSRDTEVKHLSLSWHGESDKRPTPLRRSSRLMSAPENNFDGEKLDEKHIRRSPRFSSCLDAAKETSNLNSSFIGLSDSKDGFSSKKILISLGKSDSKVFDETHLRQSQRRTRSMFEAERRESECDLIELPETYVKQTPKKRKTLDSSKNKQNKQENIKSASFIGDPIPDVEAQERWGWRYRMKVINQLNDLFICMSFFSFKFRLLLELQYAIRVTLYISKIEIVEA